MFDMLECIFDCIYVHGHEAGYFFVAVVGGSDGDWAKE